MLTFNVTGDKITRTDKTPFLSAGSKEFTPCMFTFSDDWTDAIKTAEFHIDSGSFSFLLDDSNCTVPEGAILSPGTLRIGVFGVFPDGRRISSSLSDIPIRPGAYSTEHLPEPEQSVYAEILQKTGQSAEQTAEAATHAAQAQTQAERAALTAQEANDTADRANVTAESAKAVADNAETKAQESVTKSTNAVTTADKAKQLSQDAAAQSASAVQTAAAASGTANAIASTAGAAKRIAEESNVTSTAANTTVTAVNQRIDLVGTCKPGETMTDAFPDAPRSITVYGNSIQEGVPTPSAPIPIKGTEGVNITSPFAFGFNLPLYGIKNNNGVYVARDAIDFARGVKHRECVIMELNGTEKWVAYSAGLYLTYYLDLPDAMLGYNISFCTHFRNKNTAWADPAEGIYSDHGSVKRKYFRFNGTMDEWRAYFAAQKAGGTPVILIYAAEPKEEPIPEEVMKQYRALRHSGGDFLFTAEWLGTAGQMELTYTQDVARSIRRLQKALAITAGGGGI